MGLSLLGRKIGMTRLFTEDGTTVPVTVLELGPCVVTQVKTEETDGYRAVQIGFGEIKARNSTMPVIGHDAKAGSDPLRHHREFRIADDQASEFELGQELTVEKMADHAYVDVTAISKGKGFQGGMKRHGFKGQLASHGVERKHRSPGSIGSHSSDAGMAGGLKKGKRMAGHMGAERVTVRCLEVFKVDTERNLMLVKGSVPGPNKGMVEVRSAVRLRKSKKVRQQEAMAG